MLQVNAEKATLPRTPDRRVQDHPPRRLARLASTLVCLLSLAVWTGCTLLPEKMDRPQVYNPFPQLKRVAVVPFFNQSDFAQLNGAEVANAYRHQLQQIPGFEVLPIGVVDRYLAQNPIAVDRMPDFQQLARDLGVDAVIVGSITDFTPYYPPRMGLAVRWYAANPGFHPIPPGYGLPWGTAEEEYIPEDLRFEAEFALAAEQLKTQTPDPAQDSLTQQNASNGGVLTRSASATLNASSRGLAAGQTGPQPPGVSPNTGQILGNPSGHLGAHMADEGQALPADWPDPNGFVPDRPQPFRPPFQPHAGPIMELIKQYDGSDSEFTAKLQSYYTFRDDARFGGWQSYLERTDDFINFCCYLHIAELLTARGGAGHSRTVWRWKPAPYEP